MTEAGIDTPQRRTYQQYGPQSYSSNMIEAKEISGLSMACEPVAAIRLGDWGHCPPDLGGMVMGFSSDEYSSVMRADLTHRTMTLFGNPSQVLFTLPAVQDRALCWMLLSELPVEALPEAHETLMELRDHYRALAEPIDPADLPVPPVTHTFPLP